MIKVELISTKYHLQDEESCVHFFLEVKKGRMTLTTNLEREDFRFEDSDPDRVESVAEMMLKAADIARSTEDIDDRT